MSIFIASSSPIHHPVASYHSTSPASYQGERQADCQGRTGAHCCWRELEALDTKVVIWFRKALELNIFWVPIQVIYWYRFKRYSGTDSSDTMVPIGAIRWYRFADTIRDKMNLGSNVFLWISLLPKISNAPLVCCLSARLRGLLSLVEWTVFLFALQS